MSDAVRFTDARYAREQMTARRISPSQMERTVTAPTRRYASSNPPGQTIAERATDMGKTRRVVDAESSTSTDAVAHIITAIRFRRSEP